MSVREYPVIDSEQDIADAPIWAPVASPAHKSGVSTLHALVVAVPVLMLACRFVKRYL